MKKRIFVISLIILCFMFLLLFVGIGIAQNNNSKFQYQIEEIKEIDYVVFSENNKFGVLNKNGEIVVPARYDIVQIPNPSKPVFICKYNYDTEKNEYSTKVLNDKSEQILYQYITVDAIELNYGISEIPYEKSVLKYKKNDKYGLIDFQGNIIVKAKYDEISSFDYNEGLLLVKEKDKYGVININGAVVVKPNYDKVESDGYYEEGAKYSKSGFIVANKNGDKYKYGYINFKRKQILKIEYDQIARIPNNAKNEDVYLVAIKDGKAGFYKNKVNTIKHEYEDMAYDENNNCLIIQKDLKQGVSDLEGNIHIDIKYDKIYISGKYINAQIDDQVDIYDYSSKEKIDYDNVIGINQVENDKYSILIMNNGKFRILNNSDKQTSNEEYDYLEYVADDCFITYKNKKFGVIDDKNNVITDFKYDSIEKIGNTEMLLAFNNKTNKNDIILKDKIIASMNELEIYIKDDYIIVESSSERKYYDFNGNELELKTIENRPFYAFQKNKKWGFENKNGDKIVDEKYEFVTELNEYGFAGIKQNGKWGVINSEGKVVLEPEYEIDSDNPEFIGKYYKIDLGYGIPYYIDITSNGAI